MKFPVHMVNRGTDLLFLSKILFLPAFYLHLITLAGHLDHL